MDKRTPGTRRPCSRRPLLSGFVTGREGTAGPESQSPPRKSAASRSLGKRSRKREEDRAERNERRREKDSSVFRVLPWPLGTLSPTPWDLSLCARNMTWGKATNHTGNVAHAPGPWPSRNAGSRRGWVVFQQSGTCDKRSARADARWEDRRQAVSVLLEHGSDRLCSAPHVSGPKRKIPGVRGQRPRGRSLPYRQVRKSRMSRRRKTRMLSVPLPPHVSSVFVFFDYHSVSSRRPDASDVTGVNRLRSQG